MEHPKGSGVQRNNKLDLIRVFAGPKPLYKYKKRPRWRLLIRFLMKDLSIHGKGQRFNTEHMLSGLDNTTWFFSVGYRNLVVVPGD